MLEFVPETVFRISKHYSKSGQRMPTLFVKLYVFQMCRALAHIHAMGVCHRDIKPQNLLVNTHTHQLKLCDFGSAKVISLFRRLFSLDDTPCMNACPWACATGTPSRRACWSTRTRTS